MTNDPFDDALQQMQRAGGFTIVRRGPGWAHVYRDVIGTARPDPYGGITGHARVTPDTRGRLHLEDLSIERLLNLAGSPAGSAAGDAQATAPRTIDDAIRCLRAGNFEVLARGDDWVDVRRDNPGSIARFTHMQVYRWHRVRCDADGHLHLTTIPPDGWLAIEVQRMLAAGWRLERSDGSSAVMRRRSRFHLKAARGPLLWRVLQRTAFIIRRPGPQWLHLQVDPQGHVERDIRSTP